MWYAWLTLNMNCHSMCSQFQEHLFNGYFSSNQFQRVDTRSQKTFLPSFQIKWNTETNFNKKISICVKMVAYDLHNECDSYITTWVLSWQMKWLIKEGNVINLLFRFVKKLNVNDSIQLGKGTHAWLSWLGFYFSI